MLSAYPLIRLSTAENLETPNGVDEIEKGIYRFIINMATATITNIKKEVRLLRSFVIGLAGKDSEGKYNPAFIQRLLKAASEKPDHRFYDRASFLAALHKK